MNANDLVADSETPQDAELFKRDSENAKEEVYDQGDIDAILRMMTGG